MKAFLITVLACILFFACRKSSGTLSDYQWKLTGSYMSMGGPQIFYPADPAHTIIVSFLPDGTYAYAKDGKPVAAQSGIYKKTDSTHYLIEISASSPAQKLQGVITGEILNVYPIQPICIEGCSTQFTRIRN